MSYPSGDPEPETRGAANHGIRLVGTAGLFLVTQRARAGSVVVSM